jgi:hypothetical protein
MYQHFVRTWFGLRHPHWDEDSTLVRIIYLHRFHRFSPL